MTEFVQRVAEALEHAHGGYLVYGDSVADVQACASCQQLAPLVAAAIERAWALGSLELHDARQLALRSLCRSPTA